MLLFVRVLRLIRVVCRLVDGDLSTGPSVSVWGYIGHKKGNGRVSWCVNERSILR